VILDTNALSAAADGNPTVREKIADAPGPYLPVIVIGEYRFGLLSSRERSRRLPWLEGLLRCWTILDVTQDTAAQYSEVRQWIKMHSRPIPVNDIWIAALARQHALPVLTNDPHFDDIPGVEVASF
jgi:predicted nucleic acid-binding protein